MEIHASGPKRPQVPGLGLKERGRNIKGCAAYNQINWQMTYPDNLQLIDTTYIQMMSNSQS